MSVAYRSTATVGEIRETPTGRSVMEGYFSVFDTFAEIDSAIEGRFLERVAKGAFARSFSERTPKVLLSHGNDPTVGNNPIGRVLELGEDDKGAYYRAELFRGVPEMVVDGLRHGEYGASFRFEVQQDEYDTRARRSAHNPLGLPERTLLEVKVPEFGPTPWPAYADATAPVGSLTDHFTSTNGAR